MDYMFQWDVIWQNAPELSRGLWLTLRLSAATMLFGLVLGVLGAWAKTSGGRMVRGSVQAYVEVIRNTPFLVQLLLVYLGLPRLGVRLSPEAAALAAMTLNLGAYATEIVRAGIEAVPRGQIEAGRALGLRSAQVFRLVVLKPALLTVFTALSGQFILVVLGSSIVSTISAEELTAVANNIQSQSFRPFEIYLAVGAIYVAMALGFEGVFTLIRRRWLAGGWVPGNLSA